MTMIEKVRTGLDLLREPFAANHISKLPKPTKAQTDAVKADFKTGIRCKLCGAWHHKDVVHLDYVGHAALTDRLLDADPNWVWEPVAFRDGLPAFDQSGGLWIKLTVCGITRLGYGHAAGKPSQDPGAREKEVIGDALRNAAMRFGAALDLWHKGDLHGDEAPDAEATTQEVAPKSPADTPQMVFDRLSKANTELATKAAHDKFWSQGSVLDAAKALPANLKGALKAEKDKRGVELDDDPFPGDIVPYANDPSDPGPQFDQMQQDRAA
jgi:hypothetical protein